MQVDVEDTESSSALVSSSEAPKRPSTGKVFRAKTHSSGSGTTTASSKAFGIPDQLVNNVELNNTIAAVRCNSVGAQRLLRLRLLAYVIADTRRSSCALVDVVTSFELQL
jgi:hypothetical protein